MRVLRAGLARDGPCRTLLQKRKPGVGIEGLDDIFFTTTNELRRIHEGAKTFLQPYPFDPETGLLALSDPVERFEEVEQENNGRCRSPCRYFLRSDISESALKYHWHSFLAVPVLILHFRFQVTCSEPRADRGRRRRPKRTASEA
eukprot:2886996-Rhodomonas_salina.1